MNGINIILILVAIVSLIIGIINLLYIINSDHHTDPRDIRDEKIKAYLGLSFSILIILFLGKDIYKKHCNKSKEILWDHTTF